MHTFTCFTISISRTKTFFSLKSQSPFFFFHVWRQKKKPIAFITHTHIQMDVFDREQNERDDPTDGSRNEIQRTSSRH